MTPLKDILGRPGVGVHFHAAIVDVLATIAVGCLIGWLIWRRDKTLWLWLDMALATLGVFLVGEAVHAAIGVDTAFQVWLRSLFG